MLIRAREPLVAEAGEHDAWELVNQTQKQPPSAGWLIPQPAHSALSGELAARLSPEQFPGLSEPVRRCIALHDTGWSQFDAQQIADVRESAARQPVSFVAEKPDVFLKAWTQSIDAVERICPEGGYMVSRHFDSLGQEPESSRSESDGKKVDLFHAQEHARQSRLELASGKSRDQLEALLQANRFCDLLSLFFCANIELGDGATAVFTQRAIATEPYRITQSNGGWSFGEYTPFRERAELSFSGVSFGAGAKGGAWFHVAVG